MAILTANRIRAAHWYTRKGQPLHEMPAKESGTRPTTLRDARKLFLLPSVTAYLSMLAKPGLENWKQKQVAIAALANPKQPQESDEYWIARIMEASKTETEQAAALGRDIHEALDHLFAGDTTPPHPELRPYVEPVLEWFQKANIHPTAQEVVVVNLQEGYAGRLDVAFTYGAAGIGILDYKSRKTKPGERVSPYDGQAMQLAAYATAYYGVEALPNVLATNLYISTTEPGRLEVCKHEHLDEHYRDFQAAARLWRRFNNFDPRIPAPTP